MSLVSFILKSLTIYFFLITLVFSEVIEKIIVNTDSDKALEIADKYGVSKKEREPYFASNECTNSEFFQNMAETTDTDYLIYSPCTAPLVEESTYYDFINSWYKR